MSTVTFVDKNLFIRRLDPWHFTFRDSLPYGEVIVESFTNDGVMQHWFGPRYQYSDEALRDLRQLPSTNLRLDGYIDKAKCFRRLVRSYSRAVVGYVLDQGRTCYGLYMKEEETGQDILVGFAAVIYEEEEEPAYHAKGFIWTLYKGFQKFRLWLGEYIDYWGEKEHPMNNPRMNQYFNAMDREFKDIIPSYKKDQLARMSAEQLQNVYYGDSYAHWLSYFSISPRHQRKGYGTVFLKAILDLTPSKEITFKSKDGKSTSSASQQMGLCASDAGLKLYQKLGFRVLAEFRPKLANTTDTTASYKMVKTLYSIHSNV
jgi:GNAT superfamily N-acetyltransferase